MTQNPCGFDILKGKYTQANKNFSTLVSANNKKIDDYISKHGQLNNTTTIFTIPIVVHVMHTGGEAGSLYNITSEQIIAAVDYLNQVYNGSFPGTAGAGDLQIQFELAKRTPDGICTDGIDRINASVLPGYVTHGVNVDSTNGCDELALKNLSRWNTSDYYNIWIVNKIDSRDGYSENDDQYIKGYAYPPDADSVYDGVVLLASRVMPGIKTLPHEMGHGLNLYHPFECSENSLQCPQSNGACATNGDEVSDTDPITLNRVNGEIIRTCRTGINPCTNTPYTGNTESNYMNYSDCYNLFTNGQKARMLATMNTIPSRITLVRPGNQALTVPILADLTIIGQSAEPLNITAGNSITIYFAENNNGGISALPNHVNFHLSDNDLLTPGQHGDLYLDTYAVNQSISPLSQTILLSKQVIIPANTPAGAYYLFIAADGAQQVAECDEYNNFASIQLTVSDSITPTQSGYRIWFDNSYNSGTSFTVPISNDYNISKLISANSISQGLHVIHFQFKQNSLRSGIISSFFFKGIPAAASGNGRYEYWTDNSYTQKIVKLHTNTSTIIVADNLAFSSLTEGLHTFNIRFKPTNGLWSAVTSSFFYKLPVPPSGQPKYQYWYDNNFQDTVSVNIPNTDNLILLDDLINTLPVGLHTINVRFKINGGLWSTVSSNFFYKDPPAAITTNTVARCVYWYDNNWQNPKTVYYSGHQNLISSINTDVTELPTGMHQVNMMFKDERGVWSSVISDNFNRLPVTAPQCPFNSRQYVSGVFLSSSAARQWQADNGSGFVNIYNNTVYSGANTDTLQITNAPTNWYGYTYRCIVTEGSNNYVSQNFILKFLLTWTGAADNNWENPENWSCERLPDGNVDVIINSGLSRYPVVSSNRECRSLTMSQLASITVASGTNLTITH